MLCQPICEARLDCEVTTAAKDYEMGTTRNDELFAAYYLFGNPCLGIKNRMPPVSNAQSPFWPLRCIFTKIRAGARLSNGISRGSRFGLSAEHIRVDLILDCHGGSLASQISVGRRRSPVLGSVSLLAGLPATPQATLTASSRLPARTGVLSNK